MPKINVAVLEIENYLVVALTCAVAPHGGVMTMIMLLDSMGVPALAIAMIMPLDGLMNRFRSTVNVMGEIFAKMLSRIK